jgi:hypothetical protein
MMNWTPNSDRNEGEEEEEIIRKEGNIINFERIVTVPETLMQCGENSAPRWLSHGAFCGNTVAL